MTSHKSHLDHVINFLAQNESNSYHQVCDQNLRFRYAGDKVKNLLGQSPSKFMGRNLFEFDSPVQHLSAEFLQLHSGLLESKNTKVEYLIYVRTQTGVQLMHNQVNPIIVENKVHGLYIKSQEANPFLNLALLKSGLKQEMNREIIKINHKLFQHELDIREEFILFMVMLGKLDKQIAGVLNNLYGTTLTAKAITQIVIRKLYPKFNVHSRSDLVTTAYLHGFMQTMPQLLIQNPQMLLEI